jgi:hypothetical protein
VKGKRQGAAELVKALKMCVAMLEQQMIGRAQRATDADLKQGLYQHQDYELPDGARLDLSLSVRFTPAPPGLLMIEGPRR